MQDRDVVAAVVAGSPDGIAEAYDRYAASLHAYCHSMLPGPEADEVVQDTFIIAVSKLGGLRDPDRLDAWLHAVARNECLRRLGTKGPRGSKGSGYAASASSAVPGSADPDDVLPAVTLLAGLRGRVLTACADNSPTGRAHRMSVAHRAGAFGPAGFPRAIAPAGPRWWRRVRRHPGVVAPVAVLAAVAVAAGITVIMTVSGSDRRPQASALGLSGAMSSSSPSPTPGSAVPGRAVPGRAVPGRAVPGRTNAASSPAAPSASPAVPSATMPGGALSLGPPAGPGTSDPPASPSQASPSASPTPSRSPTPGHLQVTPGQLLLTAAKGKTVSGLFSVTAENGPVSYTIKVPAAMAGKIKVAPAKGSLPANEYVTMTVNVTVTVTSQVALNTYVTVEPGNIAVRVVLKIKA
jgi:DNA-directed RNA polymerase specialized sigma24 family protein